MPLFLFVCSWFFPIVPASATLSVKVEGIRQVKGRVQVALYNDAAKFPKDGGAYQLVNAEVKGNTVEVTLRNLPAGEYAVALFHDVNSDGICNLNFAGIPKEPYGFSQNYKPTYRAPRFAETKLYIGQDTQIGVRLIH